MRELENEVERMVVMAENGTRIGVSMLSPHIRGKPREGAPAASPAAQPPSLLLPYELGFDAAVERLTRAWVISAMERANGVVSRAAELLGVERTRLVKLRSRLDKP